MGLRFVSAGENLPDNINVIVEIPAHSDPVKYEVDKETGALFVDRFMTACMHYPCDYGYVPSTLSEDGDPVDVLIICPFPLLSGSVITCRPVGMLRMEDESGPDAKIIAVPIDKLSIRYHDVNTIDDLPKATINAIEHFFGHYKDLEPNKWVKISGWEDAESAKKEIVDSVNRYKKEETANA